MCVCVCVSVCSGFLLVNLVISLSVVVVTGRCLIALPLFLVCHLELPLALPLALPVSLSGCGDDFITRLCSQPICLARSVISRLLVLRLRLRLRLVLILILFTAINSITSRVTRSLLVC